VQVIVIIGVGTALGPAAYGSFCGEKKVLCTWLLLEAVETAGTPGEVSW
jgi:hypothetical protein